MLILFLYPYSSDEKRWVRTIKSSCLYKKNTPLNPLSRGEYNSRSMLEEDIKSSYLNIVSPELIKATPPSKGDLGGCLKCKSIQFLIRLPCPYDRVYPFLLSKTVPLYINTPPCNINKHKYWNTLTTEVQHIPSTQPINIEFFVIFFHKSFGDYIKTHHLCIAIKRNADVA